MMPGRPVSLGGAPPWAVPRRFAERWDNSSVPTLNDLARSHTKLDDADLDWLHSLVSDWQLLADLSFADLILWAPTRDERWLAVAQLRPTTGPTSFQDDVV